MLTDCEERNEAERRPFNDPSPFDASPLEMFFPDFRGIVPRCQSAVAKCQDNTVKRTYLVYPMTRQEMKKLLDELDNKYAETYVEELKKDLEELSRVVDMRDNKNYEQGIFRRRGLYRSE